MKGMKKTGTRQRTQKPPRISRMNTKREFVDIRDIRGGVVACSVPVYPGQGSLKRDLFLPSPAFLRDLCASAVNAFAVDRGFAFPVTPRVPRGERLLVLRFCHVLLFSAVSVVKCFSSFVFASNRISFSLTEAGSSAIMNHL